MPTLLISSRLLIVKIFSGTKTLHSNSYSLQPSVPNPALAAAPILPTLPAFPSPIYGMPDPFMSSQTAQLQVAIQQAQLQNQLLQHNVQHELLLQQLNQLRTANPTLPHNATVPLLMQQQPLQASYTPPQRPPQKPSPAPPKATSSPRLSANGPSASQP